MAYINIRLFHFRFSLCRDIINHRNIILISFFSNNVCYSIMNIYSDAFHSVLKHLKDTEVNINNLIIMTGNFNIRDSLWDTSFPYHSLISNDLFIIADLFNLDLSISTNPIPTRYSDTLGVSDLVLDLMFLHSGSSKLNCHAIHPFWRLTSNYAPLLSPSLSKKNIWYIPNFLCQRIVNKKKNSLKKLSVSSNRLTLQVL